MSVTLIVPIRIESTPNLREHWAKRAQRAKIHRHATFWALKTVKVDRQSPRYIHLVRIAPRVLDADNNVSAFKAVVDGIADYFQINDKDLSVTYGQEKSAKTYSVRIDIA